MHAIVSEDLDRIVGSSLPWEELAGSTILVSGAAGFLPAYLVRALVRRNTITRSGMRIIGLVRNRASAESRLSDCLDEKGFSLIEQDVTNPIPREIAADFIIHCASQASPKYFGTDPIGTFLPNVLGTLRLLEHARDRNCRRFLFFSSGEVSGDTMGAPVREDSYGHLDPTALRSCYAEGKRAGETLCIAFWKQHNVPVTIVRPFHTYGPGMRLDDGRVFADFVADVLARRPIRLTSNGTARRSFCYLADSTLAFLTVLLRGQLGHAYNVGNPAAECSMRELATLLVELFPALGLCVQVSDSKGGDAYLASNVSRIVPEIAKIRALGWEPSTTLHQGFRRTILSYQ